MKTNTHTQSSFFSKKKKIIGFILSLMMTIIPMFTLFSSISEVAAKTTTIDQDKSSINQKKNEITSIKNRIASLSQELKSLQNQQNTEKQKKIIYDKQIEAYEEAMTKTQEAIAELELDIIQQDEKIKTETEKYETSYKLFLEIIRFYYEEGNVTYVDMVLKSENLNDFLSKADIISDMLEYNKNAINRFAEEKQRLINLKADREDRIKQHTEYADELKVQLAKTEELKKAAEQTIKEIEKDIEKARREQDAANRDMNEAQDEITRITKEMQSKVDAKKEYVGGVMLWPVPLANKNITSPFGSRNSPITKRPETHYGIDISAPYGTDVYAANDGVVIIAKYNNSYGNYVVIEHGGGLTTLYAHNSKLVAKVGQSVKRGDVIAKVGSTGSSTGNHCHFEVSVNGNRKNPLEYVNKP